MLNFNLGGTVVPVEFKHGRKREKIHDDIQLAAQAICLEEMLHIRVPLGVIYHASSRRRREVSFTSELRGLVETTVMGVREMMSLAALPAPVNGERCRACPLIDACQPEALADTARLLRMREQLFRGG